MLIFNLNHEDITQDKNYRCENGHGHYTFIGGLDCQGDFTGACCPGARLVILGMPGSLERGRKISQAGSYLALVPEAPERAGQPGLRPGGRIFTKCVQL